MECPMSRSVTSISRIDIPGRHSTGYSQHSSVFPSLIPWPAYHLYRDVHRYLFIDVEGEIEMYGLLVRKSLDSAQQRQLLHFNESSLYLISRSVLTCFCRQGLLERYWSTANIVGSCAFPWAPGMFPFLTSLAPLFRVSSDRYFKVFCAITRAPSVVYKQAADRFSCRILLSLPRRLEMLNTFILLHPTAS
jgi:hypothetical protein